MISPATAKTIDEFLEKCKPSPLPKEEELRRVRLQILGMAEFATKAAEGKMPGYSEMLASLLSKEEKIAAEVEKLKPSNPQETP